MGETVFSKIIDGEIPCAKVYEDDAYLAFKDINPQAPVHILIIPKRTDIASLQEVPLESFEILSHIGKIAQMLALEFKIENGYRLITNVGANAGQEVHHLHFHLIGGKKLGPIA